MRIRDAQQTLKPLQLRLALDDLHLEPANLLGVALGADLVHERVQVIVGGGVRGYTSRGVFFTFALFRRLGSALELLNRRLRNLPLLPQRRGRLHGLRLLGTARETAVCGGLPALGGAFVRLGLFFFPSALLRRVGAIVKVVVVVVRVVRVGVGTLLLLFLPPLTALPVDALGTQGLSQGIVEDLVHVFDFLLEFLRGGFVAGDLVLLPRGERVLRRLLGLDSLNLRLHVGDLLLPPLDLLPLVLLLLRERPLVLAPVEVFQEIRLALLLLERVVVLQPPRGARRRRRGSLGPGALFPLDLDDSFLLGHLLQRAQLASFLAAQALLGHERCGSRDDERPGRLAEFDLVADKDGRVDAGFEPALVHGGAVGAAAVVDEDFLAAVRELQHRVQSRGGGMLEDHVVVRGSAESEVVAARAVDRLDDGAVLENLQGEVDGGHAAPLGLLVPAGGRSRRLRGRRRFLLDVLGLRI